MNESKKNVPAIADLYGDTEMTIKQNQLQILLNQPPNPKWLKPHPTAKRNVGGKSVPVQYLPIERVEWLLTTIFKRWRVEILNTSIIANSVVITVRLHYLDPITGQWDWTDGVGANPIQTDSGAAATDWQKVKAAGVQMAAPAAKSYAIKDAAETLGQLFGKDVNRSVVNYEAPLTSQNESLNQMQKES